MLGQEGAGSGSAGPMAPLSSPHRWSSERLGSAEWRWRSGRRGARGGEEAAPRPKVEMEEAMGVIRGGGGAEVGTGGGKEAADWGWVRGREVV